MPGGPEFQQSNPISTGAGRFGYELTTGLFTPSDLRQDQGVRNPTSFAQLIPLYKEVVFTAGVIPAGRSV